MYVNKISSILKTGAASGVKLHEGSTVIGKIISLKEGTGSIKLHDGTIIPAIFDSENNMEKDKYIKFMVQKFNGDSFLLKIIEEKEDMNDEKSLNSILEELNLPHEDGKEIIISLLKYNIPATNKNINEAYHILQFLKNAGNMSDPDILLFLNHYMDEEVTENSREFGIAKKIFSQLKKVDIDFIAFLKENGIPLSYESISKAQGFLENKLSLNSFIDNIRNSILMAASGSDNFDSSLEPADSGKANENTQLTSKNVEVLKDEGKGNIISKFLNLNNSKPSEAEKSLLEAIVKEAVKSLGLDKKIFKVFTLQEAINTFKDNEKLFSAISMDNYRKLLDNLDIYKQLSPNYSLYFFNLAEGINIFKNNIIIKNKYKGSNYIDMNDVKAYVTVETMNIGRINGSLYKKNDDLSIALFVDDMYVDLFRDNIGLLRNSLKENSFKVINISVEKANKNIVPFSDFFNNSIIKDLDVKV